MALRWGRKTRNQGGQGFQAISLDEVAGDIMAGLGGSQQKCDKMHTFTVNIASQHERWWSNG